MPSRPAARFSSAAVLLAVSGGLGLGFHAPFASGDNVRAVFLAVPSILSGSVETPEGAKRYHEALRTRPSLGYVFDRFCNAWLLESSREDLESFLSTQAETGASSDQLIWALYLSREGRHLDAIHQFRAAVDAYPDNGAAWFEKAKAEAATLDFETALNDLENASNTPDGSSGSDLSMEIAKLKGRLLVRTGRTQEATEVWEALIKDSPDDLILLEDLVQLLIDEAQFEGARQYLDRLIEQTSDPRERVGHLLWLGDVHQRAGETEQAIDVYVRTLDEVGQGGWLEREALSQIEHAYRRDNNIDGLRDRYDQLIEAHPSRVEFQIQKANLLLGLNETQAAIDTWKQIIERSPGEMTHRRAFAKVLTEADRLSEAIAQLDWIVTHGDGSASTRLDLAEMHARNGDQDAARSQVMAFFEGSDKGLSSALRAARMLEQVDLKQAGEDLLRDQAQAHPEIPEYREALSEYLYRSGKSDEAIAIWRSQASDASDAMALLRATRSLESRGHLDAAYESLTAHAGAFIEDRGVLTALVDLATRTNDVDRALTWGLDLVRSASSAVEVSDAIARVSSVVRRGERSDAIILQLEEQESLTIPETCLLSALYEDHGRPFEAERVLEEAGDDERLVRQRITLLKGRQRWSEATVALESIMNESERASTSDMIEVVSLHERAAEYEQALAWIKRWKELAPGNASPWTREADLFARIGRGADAISTLERARRLFTDDVVVAQRLAESYSGEGRDDDAERIYWILYDDSQSTESRVRWAGILAESVQWTDRDEKVVSGIESRILQDPREISHYLALARAHQVNGDYDGRRQALVEASNLDAENAELLIAIASIEEEEGDFERALSTLRRATRVDQSSRSLRRLASLLVSDSQTEEAISLLAAEQEALVMDVADVLEFGNKLAEAGEWSQVAAFIESRVPSVLDDYRASYLLGVAKEEAGNDAEAIPHFLSVLESDSEITGGISTRRVQWSSYAEYYGEGVPEGVIDLLMYSQAHMAYSHQNSSPYGAAAYYASGYGGRGQVGVSLPGSLEEAHSYATKHLCTIASRQNSAEQDETVRRLAAREVASPRYLMDLELHQGDNPRAGVWSNTEAALRHADDKNVLAMYAMYAMYAMNQQDMDLELMQRALSEFRTEAPALAMNAAFALFIKSEDETKDEAWQAIQDISNGIEKPAPMMTVTAAWSLSGQFSGSTGAFSDEQRRFLTERVTAWYPRLMDSQWGAQYQPWVFQAILADLVTREDYASLADFLNKEVDIFESLPPGTSTRSPYASQAMVMMSNRGTLRVFEFPPLVLEGLPTHLISLLSQGQSGLSMMMGMDETPIDFAKLSAEFEEGDHALLRAIVAGLADDTGGITGVLNSLTEGESPSLDGLVLAASWAGRNGESVRAVECLTKASYLPMSRTKRERLDEAMVAYALELDDDERVSVEEAARRGALRLLYASRAGTPRVELAMALDSLGMETEAESVREDIAKRGSTGTAFPGAVSSFRQSQLIDYDRIRALIKDDKADAAVRLAARECNNIATVVLQGNLWQLENQVLKNVRTLLERESLMDQVIESVSPGEDASPPRLIRYAAVLEVLGKTKESIDAYSKVLEHRDDQFALIRRILLGIESDDEQQTAALLRRLDISWNSNALNDLMNQAQSSGNAGGHSRDIKLCHAIARVLDEVELASPEADSFGGAAIGMLDRLAYQWDGSGGSRTHLYARIGDEGEVPTGKLASRLDAHERLSKSMLRHGALASQSFERMLAVADARNHDLEPFVEIARSCLLAEAGVAAQSEGFSRAMMYANSTHYNFGEEIDIVRKKSPEEFLAFRWLSTGETDQLRALAAEVRQAGAEDVATRLDGIADLITCDEASFAATAARVAASGDAQSSGMVGPTDDDIQLLVEIVRVRQIEPRVLLDCLSGQIEQLGKSRQWTGSVTLYAPVARYLREESGSEAARELFEMLASSLIGEPEERAKRVARYWDPNSWSSGTPGGRLSMFHQFCEMLLNNPDLTWLCVEYLEPYEAVVAKKGGFSRTQWSMRAVCDRVIQEARTQKSAQPIIEFLEGSSWLKDPESFRSFPVLDADMTNEQDSLLSYFIMEAVSLDMTEEADLLTPILEHFKAEEPATFGIAMLRLWIQRDSPRVALETFAKWEPQITALDEEGLKQIRACLPPLKNAIPSGLSESAQRVADKLLGNDPDEVSQAPGRSDFFQTARPRSDCRNQFRSDCVV